MTDETRVGQVWSILFTDLSGEESLAAFMGPDGWIPMVASDPDRLKVLRKHAQEIADRLGVSLRVVQFDRRTDLDTIVPRTVN